MSKKKTKYITYSVIGIIVIVVLLNWGNIKFMFDMFSSYKKYENTEDTSKPLLEDSNPLLEAIEKTKNESDEDGTTTNIENTENDSESIENNVDEKGTIKNETTNTYVSILSKYNDKFTSLQEEYEGALHSIISQGYEEYKSGNISKSKLVSKYMSKGKALEKESDGKVNALVSEMEKELKENGYDPSVAKDVKSYYTSYKENRRGEIMAKAMKAVS